ncbi:uncharacterized protein TRIADDRAFT_22638, partial [Trichoplax adhaerens]
IRLVNGPTPNKGRVEVYHNNIWGSICYYGFNMKEARVACRQLGYGNVSSSYCCSNFGSTVKHIWLSNVGCSGNESKLTDCPSSGWNVTSSCGRSTYAGVQCIGTNITIPIRLVNGYKPNAGRLEVFYNNQWGSVCHREFGIEDARVVCRQLGYTNVSSYYCCSYFGYGNGPIWLSNVNCTGSESSLSACSYTGWNNTGCQRYDEAGIECTAEGALRLVGKGYDSTRGNVQIYHDGRWGAICDHGWSMQDAQVACRQLGFANVSTYQCCSQYGSARIQIWLRYLGCTGNETSLLQCSRSNWTDTGSCNNYNYAGVTCLSTNITIPIRLVNGYKPNAGRLEVFYNNQWGSVCHREFGIEDARVVCRQLGYTNVSSYYCCSYFGYGNGPIWLSNVNCTGSESSLSACSYTGWNNTGCQRYDEAGIECTGM